MAFEAAPAPLKEQFWLGNRINPEWERWFANVINPAIEVVRDVEVLSTVIESLPVPIFQAGIGDIDKLVYSQPSSGVDLRARIEVLESLGLAAPIYIFPQDLQKGASPTYDGMFLTDDLVLPKTAGKGIKVEVAAPTFTWRDLKGKVTQRNTGGSKPTHAVYKGSLRQYQFAVGKEEFFTYHIDHDHVPDSDIFLHVHWSHISGAVTGGTITIEYELSYAKGFNQAPFGANVSTTFAGTASTAQYQHILSEVQVSAESPDGNQLDSNDLEPDGIIEARVKITANDMTGATPDPFIHEVDIHYLSTSVGTKQKAPDFYV
ncbi:hypothetical protein LCGC14_1996660 [marine sediment metagenome]|uniref:Uncharacterized protein n=1 Tax=marine sediment metagenome TaxID=412755 RepID=A0A0F9I1N1_9ZZZZ